LKLYFYGHELVCQPFYPRVESLDGLFELKKSLVSLMKRHDLKGIAAPQVGILLQLVIVQLKDGNYLDLVNPRITRMYGSEPEKMETCISCPPNENGCLVRRMDTIHLYASHIENIEEVQELKFTGIDSRIIQHEVDHLAGTFFFERAKIADRNTVVRRFNSWQIKKAIQPKKEQPWQPHQ
jgi:peptide deformylase